MSTDAAKPVAYRDALNQALREELARDPDVFLLGEDIAGFDGAFKVTRGLLAEFGPERVVDTPITEAGFTGMAIGAAMAGLRPVVEIMTVNFVILAMDQIVNNAAKIHYMFGGQASVPMVIRMPGGGGHQLSSQHSQTLDAWFAHVPGLKVVCPSTPEDAKGLLTTPSSSSRTRGSTARRARWAARTTSSHSDWPWYAAPARTAPSSRTRAWCGWRCRPRRNWRRRASRWR